MLTQKQINLIKEVVSNYFEDRVIDYIEFNISYATYDWVVKFALDGVVMKAVGVWNAKGDEAILTWWK